ncbi:syntaxin-binding protein 5-like [Nilaparvata lugens]|uniref:syntaxin-binding protein 5-like n=1 Tax=Nilaparvata lugens TaxID=108931 RepID=UPI00193DF62D|nr:syntaxin-binding protein 5-like [Nilaparvata lugens]
MKKFTFKGVLDGFRSSVSQQTRNDQEIVETLRPEHFEVSKTFRHGFPFQPTAIAFDPIQHLLAIGTKTGSLRILGRPGVDAHVRHECCAAVLAAVFLTNEGGLITATADDHIHLWDFRQKRPQVVHSLKFQRERITCIHLPLQSKWLYVGSERGNIHVVNIESFVVSGYVINWNKAIEITRKTHPGAIVHLSDNPLDSSKLLIGYECGQLVLWDLRQKQAEARWQCAEGLRSVSWHHEGKQFMCSHVDGSLSTWNVRQSATPINLSHPHAKLGKDGKPEPCKPIQKVEWKSSKTGPDMQEPYAIVVLLHNDLVVIDLLSQGFPCFENPYPMDLHESAVTCCTYLADCPSDLIPAFYSVGSRNHKRTGFSEKEWPLSGGEWNPTSCSYNEIILTGHADGSVKFWDASAGSLQVLYKLKTGKVFEKPRTKSVDGGGGGGGGGGSGGGVGADDDPFAVHLISLCPESRKLCIAGASGYVILFKFKKSDSVSDTITLEIPIIYEVSDDPECSPDYEFPPRPSLLNKMESTDVDNKKSSLEYTLPVRVRPGPQKKPAGFQAYMVCLTPIINGQVPGAITALTINSSYGLMAYGNESGLVIVDIIQKCHLLNIGTPDLYGSADPYQRVPKSPKRNATYEAGSDNDRCRSPSIDQVLDQDDVEKLKLMADLDELQEEMDEMNLLEPITIQSCSALSSAQISPIAAEDVEAAEEAISLVSTTSDEAGKIVEDCSKGSGDEEKFMKPVRRGSVTAKLFSLTKKLSRSEKPKGSSHDDGEKPPSIRKRMSIFFPNSSPNMTSPADPEDECGESGVGGVTPECEKHIPVIEEPEDDEEEDDETPGQAVRPTELPLFDSQGKPIRPTRKERDRKRVSLDRQPPGRDTRLLSVPNIKFNPVRRKTLADIGQKNPAANNQSFGNFMRRMSKSPN